MRTTDRVAFMAAIAALGIAGASGSAEAQRRHPVVAQAASPRVPPPPTSTYGGVPVMIDPRRYPRQQGNPQSRYQHSSRGSRQPVVYYVPVPVQVGYGYGYGYGGQSSFGGVTDVNGRPLYVAEENMGLGSVAYGLGTPSLTGAPFVVGEGGTMVVDFGNGDRRTVPSCAALVAAQDPDGRPRTIFYQPPADGLVLRAGQTGRVVGAPPAGAATCYAADVYGRVVLDY